MPNEDEKVESNPEYVEPTVAPDGSADDKLVESLDDPTGSTLVSLEEASDPTKASMEEPVDSSSSVLEPMSESVSLTGTSESGTVSITGGDADLTAATDDSRGTTDTSTTLVLMDDSGTRETTNTSTTLVEGEYSGTLSGTVVLDDDRSSGDSVILTDSSSGSEPVVSGTLESSGTGDTRATDSSIIIIGYTLDEGRGSDEFVFVTTGSEEDLTASYDITLLGDESASDVSGATAIESEADISRTGDSVILTDTGTDDGRVLAEGDYIW